MQQRVLHMIGSLNVGGSQAFVLNIYKNIDRNLIQFDFVMDRESENALKPVVEALGGKIYVMPKFTGYNFQEVIKSWNVFFQNHPEYKIIHSHVRSYAILYLPVAKKYGLKTIIHSHSISNGRGLSAFGKKILQFPIRFKCDEFLACSLEAGKWLFGERIVEGSHFHIVKNGIETSKYIFSEEGRKRIRMELGLGEEETYISVGRLSAVKNHAFLLRIFRKILIVQPNAVLLLIGDGPEKDAIQSQVEELGLQEHVRMLGIRMDIPDLLWASDCFLFPSKWEGLGIAAIEAQASSLPCLCSTAVPGLAKVTEFCKFISLRDSDAWVKEALSFRPIRRNTGNDIVEAGFDVSEVTKWMENFYLSLVTK